MSTSARPNDFPPGLRFGELGRYELRERIGRGGMADVFKVVDTNLNNRLYAVKILSSSTLAHANPEILRDLFLAEAAALSRIRDNNVVQIVSNGLLGDAAQTPYMVMEYLDGQDLSALLKAEIQLPIARAVDIILAVCAGINACHLANVIHRDLKPANIFLDRTLKGEEPKVLDFSVAKIPIDGEQTTTDLVVGTESYMAPEVANRKPATERSDQYSIGALLYRCLTGQLPRGFLSNARELRPDIPLELDATLLRAMDIRPDRRFANVHDLGRALLAHASALGRAKWDHYYTTPPLPMRPAFSAPLPVSLVPVTTARAVATKVGAYDFRAHERTTHAQTSPSSITISDPPRAELSQLQPVMADAVVSRPSRRPTPLIVAFLSLTIVAAGAITTVFVRRSREAPEVRPRPPAWTQTPTPVETTPAPAPSPAEASQALPDRPPTVIHAVPVTPPEGTTPLETGRTEAADIPAQPLKKKRHRRLDSPVRYTREGNPIVE